MTAAQTWQARGGSGLAAWRRLPTAADCARLTAARLTACAVTAALAGRAVVTARGLVGRTAAAAGCRDGRADLTGRAVVVGSADVTAALP